MRGYYSKFNLGNKPLAREIQDSDSEADFTGSSNPKPTGYRSNPMGTCYI